MVSSAFTPCLPPLAWKRRSLLAPRPSNLVSGGRYDSEYDAFVLASTPVIRGGKRSRTTCVASVVSSWPCSVVQVTLVVWHGPPILMHQRLFVLPCHRWPGSGVGRVSSSAHDAQIVSNLPKYFSVKNACSCFKRRGALPGSGRACRPEQHLSKRSYFVHRPQRMLWGFPTEAQMVFVRRAGRARACVRDQPSPVTSWRSQDLKIVQPALVRVL